ncbi:hypothetical protein AAFC00_000377 [Neodothiora populina]|uniref:Uncharacterized protein n=1 Tax=Neodothiora populina TaxID=2781224 RepID=A0ABR3PCQ9_9PEZI
MASNGPYYQPVPPEQNASDDFKLSQGLLDYAALAPPASMYPDPNQTQMDAGYHHTQQQLVENEVEDHAQLQGLVEAATSAAAQEQIRQRAQLPQLPQFAAHEEPHIDSSEQELASLLQRDATRPNGKRKRSHPDETDADPELSLDSVLSDRPKRQKRTTLASSESQNQEGHVSLRQHSNPIESPHHLDARAAGVHSAAALFRPPSDSSKKYTRPPMSKLFASLELSPENFLYLQAAAKQFMLDPEYPQRQACVGNRGKGDSDMVKLRLHHCVREFLEQDGWGEKYFGENAPPPDDGGNPSESHRRKFLWPHDKDRIIALCTPLLRRMVTNERQRQYAVESRKVGKTDNKNDVDNTQENDANSHGQSNDSAQQNFDPRLAQTPAYQIYMLDKDTKQLLRDRVDYALHEHLDWQLLTQEVQNFRNEMAQSEDPSEAVADMSDTYTVKVLTSGGLTTISTEGEWQLACQDVHSTVWLENLIKIVVDCAP